MMIDLIKMRRSIRKFTPEKVGDEIVNQIIEAGIFAPSGKNNQPWKFVVVRDSGLKEQLSDMTHYSQIIRDAPVLIVVFLDHHQSYDYIKDVQAVGACIQNMLLAVSDLRMGGVWLGEILKNKERVHALLSTPEHFELMAVIALGHPAEKGKKRERFGLDQVIFSKIG